MDQKDVVKSEKNEAPKAEIKQVENPQKESFFKKTWAKISTFFSKTWKVFVGFFHPMTIWKWLISVGTGLAVVSALLAIILSCCLPAKKPNIAAINFSLFNNGLAIVTKNGRSGLVDKDGKVVMPCVYDEVNGFYDDRAIVVNGTSYALATKSGKIITEKDYANIRYDVFGKCFIYYKNTKFGIMNKDGKELGLNVFDSIMGFSENGLALIRIGTKFGYINNKGEIVIDPIFDDAYSFYNGLAVASMEENKYGFIDKKGEFVITPTYFSIDNNAFDKSNYALVSVSDTKKQIIDKKGKVIADDVIDLFDDCIVTLKDGTLNIKGIKDSRAYTASKVQDVYQFSFIEQDFITLLNDDSSEIILNENFETLFTIPKDQDSDNYEMVFDIKDNKAYMYDGVNKSLCAYGTTYFTGFTSVDTIAVDGMFVVTSDNKCGVVNLKGETIINCEYNSISATYDGYFVVMKKNDKNEEKWGVVNRKNKIIIPLEYDQIGF